jgi:hypothetical protein
VSCRPSVRRPMPTSAVPGSTLAGEAHADPHSLGDGRCGGLHRSWKRRPPAHGWLEVKREAKEGGVNHEVDSRVPVNSPAKPQSRRRRPPIRGPAAADAPSARSPRRSVGPEPQWWCAWQLGPLKDRRRFKSGALPMKWVPFALSRGKPVGVTRQAPISPSSRRFPRGK